MTQVVRSALFGLCCVQAPACDTSTKPIAGAVAQSCPNGQVVRGFDAEGNLLCTASAASWNALQDVPADFADGVDDTTNTTWGTLAGIPAGFSDGTDDIATWSTLSGIPSGFADGSDDVATWGTLSGIPSGFADGTDDLARWGTLSGIPAGFADGVDDVATWGSLSGIPAGFADGMDDVATWGTLSGIPPGFADGVDNSGGADVLNVKDFGAMGNGITDDTVAINFAISMIPANGAAGVRTVYFPPGLYVVTDALRITQAHVELAGSGGGSVLMVPGSFNPGAAGVIHFDLAPALRPASPTVRDLAISFAQPDTTVRANLTQYPPAIEASGHAGWQVRHVSIYAAWDGIRAHAQPTGGGGWYFVGNAIIEDLQMSAFNAGVSINGQADSIRITDMHFLFSGLTGDAVAGTGQIGIFYEPETVGLELFGRVDDLHLHNALFISGTHITLDSNGSVAAGPVGMPHANATNCWFDGANGIVMHGGDLSVSGAFFSRNQANRRAVHLTGGWLRIANSKFWALNADLPMVEVASSGNRAVLQIANSLFQTDAYDVSAVRASGSVTQVILSANQFHRVPGATVAQPTIDIQPSARATIMGNVALDNVTGSGVFINVPQDNHSIILGNSALGWAINTPASPSLLVSMGNIAP